MRSLLPACSPRSADWTWAGAHVEEMCPHRLCLLEYQDEAPVDHRDREEGRPPPPVVVARGHGLPQPQPWKLRRCWAIAVLPGTSRERGHQDTPCVLFPMPCWRCLPQALAVSLGTLASLVSCPRKPGLQCHMLLASPTVCVLVPVHTAPGSAWCVAVRCAESSVRCF